MTVESGGSFADRGEDTWAYNIPTLESSPTVATNELSKGWRMIWAVEYESKSDDGGNF